MSSLRYAKRPPSDSSKELREYWQIDYVIRVLTGTNAEAMVRTKFSSSDNLVSHQEYKKMLAPAALRFSLNLNLNGGP